MPHLTMFRITFFGLFSSFLGLWLVPSIGYAQEKVAVIVSSGDSAMLRDVLEDLQARAEGAYKRRGFKVIVLGGAKHSRVPLTAQEFREALISLREVKDLRLDFMGHGQTVTIEKKLFSGPGLHLTADRHRFGFEGIGTTGSDKKYIWQIPLHQQADEFFFKGLARTLGLEVPVQDEEFIYHTTIASALTSFRANNPAAITTINLVNCASGALAQHLRNEPNTVVFANSPNNVVAVEKSNGDGKARNGLSLYYDAFSQSTPLSVGEARARANEALRKLPNSSPEYVYYSGRSPIFEYIVGWCEQNDLKRAMAMQQASVLHKLDGLDLETRSLVFSEYQNILDSFELEKSRYFRLYSPESLKSSYKQCLERAAGPGVEKNLDPARARFRAPYASQPNRPIQLLVAKLKSILADRSQHQRILNAILQELAISISDMKKQGLDDSVMSRSLALSQRLVSGSLSQNEVIERIQHSIEQIRSACSTNDIYSSPCRDFAPVVDKISAWVLPNPAESDVNCEASGGLVFECLFSAEKIIAAQVSRYLSYYWIQLTDSISPSGNPCAYESWYVIERVEKNLEMDRECLNIFYGLANEDELSQLRRLRRLMNREL